MLLFLSTLLASFNQILTAALAVTAFSLLLYSLTFNLQDRVARSFSLMLAAVSVVFLGDVLASLVTRADFAEIWLRLQWAGIAFLPATYLHFSDALLETTGLRSRGRRRLAVRVGYGLGAMWFALSALGKWLVADPTLEGHTQHLQPGPLFTIFSLMFAAGSAIAWINLYRAYLRCLTATTRRRMNYLLLSSVALPISVFPYLLLSGGSAAVLHPFLFWALSVFGNLMVGFMMTTIAYTVAFFGTAQADRVIKSRLFQWLLRGPFAASITLAVMVIAGRLAKSVGVDSSPIVAFSAIGTLLFLHFGITLVRVPLERWLFYGGSADRGDVQRLQLLEERLLTEGDAQQFLESVVAAACDLLRIPSAFVAVLDSGGARVEARVGPDAPPEDGGELSSAAMQSGSDHRSRGTVFVWGHYWVLPLHAKGDEEGLSQPDEVLGLLALRARAPQLDLTEDELGTLQVLADRAAAALEDRRLQKRVFSALNSLLSQADRLQRLRAASRYSSAQMLQAEPALAANLVQNVRDALTQYWGGPKFNNSPLMRLRVVEQALRDHDGNAANALRAVLQNAIERLKPEGQRKFTAEWILYNILEMKFMQGKRVREVAMRLAMSEADLYRKQRVAIEQVARAIAEMERDMSEAATDYLVAG